MPFVKGQVANPSGRPKLTEPEKEAKRILTERTPRAAQRLGELLESEDDRVALAASLALLDRQLGKAPAAQEDRDALAKAARPTWVNSLGRAAIVEIARKALAASSGQTVDAERLPQTTVDPG